ncbi:MAG: transposase [Planctomycetota bacterium]|jgi:hypothetical protein
MPDSAREGTILAQLIRLSVPLVKAAEKKLPRAGPGAPPGYPEWQIAVLIMVAVAARRKSKSAQFRYLYERRVLLMRLLNMTAFPVRSTYFNRYRRAHAILNKAILLQGRRAIREGVADADAVSVDKSLLTARGPEWPNAARNEGRRPRGVDEEAAWGYSKYRGWVYGYSYEVVVSATKGSVVCPLLVSVGTANASEHHTFGQKIKDIPSETRYVLADAGYDSNAYGEAVEIRSDGTRTGRRFVCPLQHRGGKPSVGRSPHRGRRERSRRHRAQRSMFYKSRRGRRLYRQRGLTVEPFNDWFKGRFDLAASVWHRGFANNVTQVTAAIFVYQLLLRYHHKRGGKNGNVQWILDAL